MSMNTLAVALQLLCRTSGLADALYDTSPGTYLTREEAIIHAMAAIEAATSEIPVEILLGVAWVESRYSPNAISRIERDKRITGIPTWKSPPRGTRSFFCGVTQVSAGDSWEKCQEFRDIATAYRVLVLELNRWLSPRICNHNLTCALTGYNGGFQALKVGTKYASVVMWRAKLIKEAIRRKDL